MTRTVHTTFQYRLNPTTAQEAQMRRFAGARRWVWNWALTRKIAHYKATHKTLRYAALCKELTLLKRQPETTWLRYINAQLLQQALRDLERTFQSFFDKRSTYPKLKSKKRDKLRFRLPQYVTVGTITIQAPTIGSIPAIIHRPIVGISKSATFKQESDGHWYVSVVVEQTLPERTDRSIQSAIGVDLGLKTYAVLSDGTSINNPRYYRNQLRKLARLQRSLDRKCHGSANRLKARQRFATRYRKTTNQRKDFLHKVTTQLIRKYDLIAIEDLSVRGLVKTKLSMSVMDAGWGKFRELLTYKADRMDKHLIVIGRFFPSSKTCGCCGTINDALTLADRTWTCLCGAHHDRDVNAAQNILVQGLRLANPAVAAGYAETQNACGELVSPITVGAT